MSSNNGKNGIPSNEEVIDELTKDLRSSTIKTDSCADDDTSHFSGASDSEAETPLNEETEIRDEDYIDDKLLKERDEKLSEQEKRVGTL